jgi:hypothetical protein
MATTPIKFSFDDEDTANNSGANASGGVPTNPAADPTADPSRVILDIRRDIEQFKAGGQRKELVEALRDQFIATRHQAATAVEAVKMLALEQLKSRLPEIKSVTELLRVTAALSKMSEQDLAIILGVPFGSVPFSGDVDRPLLNFRQYQLISGGGGGNRLVIPERGDDDDRSSNPIRDASHVLESHNLLSKFLQDRTRQASSSSEIVDESGDKSEDKTE